MSKTYEEIRKHADQAKRDMIKRLFPVVSKDNIEKIIYMENKKRVKDDGA